MIQTVYDSASLPADERVPRFDELQATCTHPMRATSPCADRFHARARALDLAAVNVVELSVGPSDIRRTPRQIRAHDPRLCAVVFPVAGRLELSHGGRETALEAGDLAIYDSSHPFQLRTPVTARLVRAHLPVSLLPLPRHRLERLLGVRLSARDGLGGLLTHSLTRFVADAAEYRPADAVRLGSVVTDLLAALVNHELEDDPAELPDDSRQRTLRAAVDAFIERNLGDPDLTPASVAAAHHISVSYLHRLFRGEDETVAASIRRRRLERARRDLADPALAAVPVHRIATRWGFADHATFTRAFRSAYDVAPKDYRAGAILLSA